LQTYKKITPKITWSVQQARVNDGPMLPHCVIIMHFSKCNYTMSSTTDTLASYLADTHDAKGVVDFIREKWPKSLSSYVSQTKKQWMTLDVINENYASQYAAALTTVDTAMAAARSSERETLRNALARLVLFNDMNLAGKSTVQRRLRAAQYSGHALVDDLIASFTIFSSYIDDLRVSVPERTALQKAATSVLEAKSIESITIQASELISKCKATLKDQRATPFETAAALGLLTGRRTVEIFKTAQLTPVSENALLFSGQAKEGDLAEAVEYEIPVLAPPELINSALARLRLKLAKDCSDLTNRDVNLKYANSYNAAARRLLGKEHHFHSLRVIIISTGVAFICIVLINVLLY
jgi:Telomere resolvase